MILDRNKLEQQLAVLCSLISHLENKGEDMLAELAGSVAHDGFGYYREHKKELNKFYRKESGELNNA